MSDLVQWSEDMRTREEDGGSIDTRGVDSDDRSSLVLTGVGFRGQGGLYTLQASSRTF